MEAMNTTPLYVWGFIILVLLLLILWRVWKKPKRVQAAALTPGPMGPTHLTKPDSSDDLVQRTIDGLNDQAISLAARKAVIISKKQHLDGEIRALDIEEDANDAETRRISARLERLKADGLSPTFETTVAAT